MQPAIWTEALSDLHQEVKGFFLLELCVFVTRFAYFVLCMFILTYGLTK